MRVSKEGIELGQELNSPNKMEEAAPSAQATAMKLSSKSAKSRLNTAINLMLLLIALAVTGVGLIIGSGMSIEEALSHHGRYALSNF